MASYIYDPIDLTQPSIRLARLLGGEDDDIQCEIFQAWLNEPEDIIPYEALSYTWGITEMTDHVIINGSKLAVTQNLYLALQYLRFKDQDRIIWIDGLCIDQANDAEKGHQVQQMGDIYDRAECVIIWLGTATYETNVLMDSMKLLEKESIGYSRNSWGVSDLAWRKVWSDIQPKLRSMHSDLENRQRIGLDSLFGRSWFKRVWIVQEVANARAAIIVCGVKSVSARIFALVPSLMGFETDPHCQSILDIMPGRSREESWWSQKRDLRTLLLKFSSSDASDSRDNIYALLGLSSDACDSALLRADYSKPVYAVIKDAILFLLHIPEKHHADLLCRWTMPLFLERLCFLGDAVLSWAIYEDNEAITTLLLARDDIDVNFKDHKDGRTPLLMAVEKFYMQADVARYKDNETIIRLLLARNDIDVNFNVHGGKTPLLTAVGRNRKEVVKLLLARDDVDMNLKDQEGEAPLLVAVHQNYKEIVELLLARDDVDVNLNGYRGTPLTMAVEKDRKEVVKLLLARDDIKVNVMDYEGTPLLSAVRRNYKEVVKLLLARDDVDVNSKDKNGRTLLQIAVEGYYTEIAELLLKRDDIDVNSKDEKGRTPLQIAVERYYFEIATLLLKRDDVDISWVGENDKTLATLQRLAMKIENHNQESDSQKSGTLLALKFLGLNAKA
jgi:ankyrin repeat protein